MKDKWDRFLFLEQIYLILDQVFALDQIRLEILDLLLNNLVFSLRLLKIICLSYQRMLILLTCKEPNNMFFDTFLWVKIFVEGRGVLAALQLKLDPDLEQTNSMNSVELTFFWTFR